MENLETNSTSTAITPAVEGKRARSLARWLVLVAAVIYGGAFFIGGAVTMLHDPEMYRLALSHFSATIGLPSAALVALCLVVFLDQTSGAIEFEGLGIKFKGASGPIVLWVFSFLAIAAATKVLW